MNLDGETNLKEKFAYAKDFKENEVETFSGYLECDKPNENLDEWDCNIHAYGKVLNSK